MAAKLLHSFTDENPDMRKQIGCMTGIFQLLDRRHIVTGRRFSHKRLPSGNPHSNNCSLDVESNNPYHQYRQKEVEYGSYKNVNEKQRVSSESSRASFSSSSCSSSFSSLDCNKTSQPETSSLDRIIFPETPSRDPTMGQSSSSQFGRGSLDLRDVVKDSMYREARGLSVRTTFNEEAATHVVKHKDSPRPLQLPKSVDESFGKHVELKESLRVLARLQEAPCYFSEAKEHPRSSYEAKNESLLSISKDAPRFSYDGREINRLSFESRDTFKCSPKLKELPRLSLDGKESSLRNSNPDLKINSGLRNLQKGSGSSTNKVPVSQQTSEAQKRPPSVVAKLMGLEALPDSSLATESQIGLIKTCSSDYDTCSGSSKANDRPVRISNSPRNSWKDSTSPRWKDPDSIMKPISSSRIPIEPAPWRQVEGGRGSPKKSFKHLKSLPRTADSLPSVYGEIEKKLKSLEFTKSGKDLRALKQILEAMQAKVLLHTGKEEQASKFGTHREYMSTNQNQRWIRQRNPQNDRVVASASRGTDSSRTSESPIVIMKPAKLVQESGIPASSVIPIDGLPVLHKLRDGEICDSRKGSASSRTGKDQSPRNIIRDTVVSSTERKTNSRNLRSTHTVSRPQQVPKENSTGSVKSFGSVSPRLQQKKIELEKRSRPPTPSSDLSKSRRQSNRQPTESGSPGGKLRPKSHNMQQNDDLWSEVSSESRNLSFQGDDISLHSDSNVAMDLKMETGLSSVQQSSGTSTSQSSSRKVAKSSVSGLKPKTSVPRLNDEVSLAELATVAPEHPSPVSVLDVSVYRDDTLSPVKQISHAFEDEETQKINNDDDEDQWKPVDNILPNEGSGLKSDISLKKLQNIEDLVQKLRRLNSSHDEDRTDYIASLCENSYPDHRYISEILLASGLLLRDLSSSLTTIQLHPSGHPINPELFFVLEQTKANTPATKEQSLGKVVQSKSNQERLHRRLIFDVVNEILVGKLTSFRPTAEPWLKPNKLAGKSLSAQKLLKELCSDIEQLQANNSECGLEDEGDGLKSILQEDVMHRSDSWTHFCSETPVVVLDVERLIFKDLVDDIVMGEAASSKTKQGRRCRQPFAK